MYNVYVIFSYFLSFISLSIVTMGITGGHKALTYCLTNVTLDELNTICCMRRDDSVKAGVQRGNKPTIDVDVSWVIRRFASIGKDAISNTLRLCFEFVRIGFVVVLVCDGSIRHHTKRATIKRSIQRYKSQITILEKRKRLMIISDLRTNTDSVSTINELNDEEEKLSNSIKRAEAALQSSPLVDVGQSLYDELRNLIESFTDDMIGDRGGVMTVCQAKYQADSVLAYRCNAGINDVVLGNDTDLAVHCGKKCFAIKDFKFSDMINEQNKIRDIEIFCSCLASLGTVAEKINIDINNNKRVIKPPTPLFEGIDDPKVRSLIAVGIGSDVTDKNIKSVTPKSLYTFLSNVNIIISRDDNRTLYQHIMDFFLNKNFSITKNKIISDDDIIKFKNKIDIYVEAFMYEPAIYFVGEDGNTPSTPNTIYIHGNVPNSLHKYVADFSENNKNINIIDDKINEIDKCVGPGNGSHIFLCDEDSCTCITCNSHICSLCSFIDNNNKYCIDCYASEKELPGNETYDLSINKMRESLIASGLDVLVSDLASDVIDWYDSLILKKQLIYDNEIVNQCSVPSENSDYLNNITSIYDYDIKEGGRFIRNESITLLDRLELIGLLSDLVSLSMEKDTDKTTTLSNSVMPSILINFADNARIHKGFRLIKRCIRHAIDPQAISILHATAQIIKYKEEVGLLIKHQTKASMKKNIYDCTVCFTRNKLVACSCNCKVGSNGSERVLCVHILPVIYQYSLLLYDGLSDHILCELANEWNISYEKSLTSEQNKELLYYLFQLKQSTGVCTYMKPNISINEFLKPYKVGTESSRLEPPPPKDPALLGPLRNLNLSSTIQQAMLKINNIKEEVDKILDNESIIEEDDIFGEGEDGKKINDNTFQQYTLEKNDPDYNLICRNINEIIKLIPTDDDISHTLDKFIGFKLAYSRNNIPKIDYTNTDDIILSLNEAIEMANDENRGRIHSCNTSTKKNNVNTNIEDNDNSDNDYSIIEDGRDLDSLLKHHSVVDESIACEGKPRYHDGRCCYINCTSINERVMRIPPIVKPKQFTNKTSIDVIKTYYKKRCLRREWLMRCGLSPTDPRKDLRICVTHPIQKYVGIKIPWKNHYHEFDYFECDLVVPLAEDENHVLTRSEKLKRGIVEPKVYNNKRTKHRTTSNNLPKRNQRCSFVKCNVKATHDGTIKFTRLPPPVTIRKIKTLNKNHINKHYQREAIRKFARNEWLRRIGLSISESRIDIRICNKHPMDVLSKHIEWNDYDDNKQSTLCKFIIPKAVGLSSDLNTGEETIRDPKGVGIDRLTTNYFSTAKTLSQQQNNHDISWGIAFAECLQREEDDMISNNNSVLINKKTRRIEYEGKVSIDNKKFEKTCVKLNELEDEHIKNDTGFRTKQLLICFIILICNGDVSLMTTTNTKLTWFEEWYFFFERIWAKANQRYCDSVRQYKKPENSLRKVYDNKMKILLKARRMWPMYVTMKEDETLRDERWNKHYKDRRVVMWDNTNVKMYKPSSAEAQRNTFSTYYANNVGKGAVFVQLCGWMGTFELWMGAVSDSDYMIRSGILQLQQQYVPLYDEEYINIPFVNILDKGYRIVSAAWRTGGQFVLQPSFAKSDHKFTSLDVIRSAAVASDRGGNERAVRIAKMCGSIKNGLHGNGSPTRLCDLWLGWSFMSNFMFKKVL